MKKIKLVEGFHITKTEKKAIQKMLESGWVSCRNRPNTKNYEVLQGYQNNGQSRYKIRIGSFYTNTIGAKPQWNYTICLIETNIQKPEPQLAIF
jgi:hypothetical protein